MEAHISRVEVTMELLLYPAADLDGLGMALHILFG